MKDLAFWPRSGHAWFFLMHAVHYSGLRPRTRDRLMGTWRSLVHRRGLARDRGLVGAILAEVEGQSRALPPDAWSVQRAFWTGRNVTFVYTGPRGKFPVLVLRLAHTALGESSLRREMASLGDLRANPSLAGMLDLLPEPLAGGFIDGRFYSVQWALPGFNMGESLLRQPECRQSSTLSALSIIAQLHRNTARKAVVDARMLDCWVHARLRSLEPLARDDGPLKRLGSELDAALIEREVRIGWIHGDFWPGNVLVARDGASVCGIVDWDLASPDELPEHDLLHFELSAECLLTGSEIGDVVLRRLNGQPPKGQARAFLADLDQTSFGIETRERAMILLYWLRFVTNYLLDNPYRAGDRWWMGRNVRGVLAAL